jgi:hypothetical protein
MNFFNNIFSSKLRILTFIVLPSVIMLLILAWVYLLFFGPTTPQKQIQSPELEITNSVYLALSSTTTNSSTKNNVKSTFGDLDKTESKVSSQSSVIKLTSPVAATPETDSSQIVSLLDNIETLDNNDDVSLDNQILEN